MPEWTDNNSDGMMFEIDENMEKNATIKVFGVGGGGGNAIDTMISHNLHGVDFVVANTDAQALRRSSATAKVQLGAKLTKGLGAGANPDIGREAANEDRARIAEVVGDADMVFVAAGLGGGTGTGAAPIIAEVARENGALVVGVVTKPFDREGKQRGKKADLGVTQLKSVVDSLIVIPNDRLLGLAGKNMSILDAFKPSDDILRQAVQGISDLITQEGFINVDFADVQAIMSNRGLAMMGIGEADGEKRASEAAMQAISSPLLEDIDINGAMGVLLNITSSSSMTMEEYDEIARVVQEKAHEDANIITGLVINEDYGDKLQVTAIATGFGDNFDRDSETGLQDIKNDAAKAVTGKVDRDVPAYIRVKNPRDQGRQQNTAEEEEFDIPAFLRKRVD